jgi:hypothetical protein
MEMTPRELLTTHYNSLEADDLLEWLDREGFMIVPKDSIRAAENDAPERAALICAAEASELEEIDGFEESDIAAQIRNCEVAIRKLKRA